MAKDKNIRVIIPAEFNKQLVDYLIETEEIGVNNKKVERITKAELIIKLARMGFKYIYKVEK